MTSERKEDFSSEGAVLQPQFERTFTEGLYHEEQLFRAIFDKMPIPVIVIDSRGNLKRGNILFNELQNENPSDTEAIFGILRKPYTETPGGHPMSILEAAKARSSDLPPVIEVHSPESGNYFELNLSLPGKPGNDTDVLVAVHDITGRKLREIALEKRIANVITFAEGEAHDLKNLLGTPLGYGQYGMRLTGIDSEARSFFEYIVEGLKKTKERLMDFQGRIETAGELEKRPIDIVRLVKGYASQFVESERLIPGRGMENLKFAFGSSVESKVIIADPEKIISVIFNLLRNSVDAMTDSSQKQITVLIQDNISSVWLYVTNTGPGIPADKIEEIFNSYYSTKDEGNGIGLPDARRKVEAHDGKIWVQEPVESNRTTFVIELPVGEI